MEWEADLKVESIMTGTTILFTEMNGCPATRVTEAILPATDVMGAEVF